MNGLKNEILLGRIYVAVYLRSSWPKRQMIHSDKHARENNIDIGKTVNEWVDGWRWNIKMKLKNARRVSNDYQRSAIHQELFDIDRKETVEIINAFKSATGRSEILISDNRGNVVEQFPRR